MRTLLRLVLLLALVFGAVWVAQNVDFGRHRVRAAGELSGAVKKVDKAISDLDVKAIAAELKETGRVVRRRAGQVAHATADARTTAAIKAKLVLDPSLSALEVSVDTTDGRVTLAGRVDSAEDIVRAIQIAFEQDEVSEVISTLQVRSTREGSGGAQ